MKTIIALFITISLISCNQEQPQLKYNDVDISSNDILHLTDVDGNYSTFKELISSLKGKVIYVNIWNSASTPSVDLISAVEDLEKRTTGKNIVYLNINTDQDIEILKSNAATNNMEHNYAAPTFLRSYFIAQHQVFSFPTYMIYGKKGNLIDQKALPPTDSSIATILTTLAAAQ